MTLALGARSHLADNHRIVRVGRNLWRSPSPASLPRQGHQEQVTPEQVQMGFECLWKGRLHDLPGQLVPKLCHLSLL